MTDMSVQRTAMINSQLRPNRVNDERIIDAIDAVAREDFVPREKQAIAYVDESIEIADGRYLMEPRVFARLLVAADIQSDELVLNVACGTGYSTAVLAGLADAVVAIEQDKELFKIAEDNLAKADVMNAAVIEGTCSAGEAKQGPYDVIFVGGGVAEIPTCLTDQLKDGGRLVTVRLDDSIGRAHMVTRVGDTLEAQDLFDAYAEILPGFEAKQSFVF